MRTIDKIGRFSICDHRGKWFLRWWDRPARITRSKRLSAETLPAARAEARAIIRTIAEPLELIAPERRITKDPTFGEVWISYERQKEATLSKQRFVLLKNRLDIYYRPNIWNEPMSNMSAALHRFVLFLQRTEYSRLKGKARAAATPRGSPQAAPEHDLGHCPPGDRGVRARPEDGPDRNRSAGHAGDRRADCPGGPAEEGSIPLL